MQRMLINWILMSILLIFTTESKKAICVRKEFQQFLQYYHTISVRKHTMIKIHQI